jgi:hypothetical protein
MRSQSGALSFITQRVLMAYGALLAGVVSATQLPHHATNRPHWDSSCTPRILFDVSLRVNMWLDPVLHFFFCGMA